MKNLTYLLFGTLFGFFLSKARATDYDTIINMFRFRDPQLWGVIGVAIAVIGLGLFFLNKKGVPTFSRQPLDWEPITYNPSRLIGAFLFGTGWALAGTCPGTALAQIGEGKWVAVFTVIGIAAGVWAYHKYQPLPESKDNVC